MEWIFALFMMANGEKALMPGWHPLPVKNCQQALHKATPSLKKLKRKHKALGLHSGCFKGSPEELREYLKKYKFKLGKPA